VGSIIYLTTTRPNISFSIGILSSFMKNPYEGYWFVAKRVRKYLEEAQGFGLQYS